MDQPRPAPPKALRTLLPFLEVAGGDAFLSRVEAAPAEELRGFYLFRASCTVLPDGTEDIQRFIERRYLSLLSAAHRAGWTVLTAAVGSRSGVVLQFGFMPTSGTGSSDPYVFERKLRGVLPGLDLQFHETRTVESSLGGKHYGGLIAGIPTLRIDDDRQYFSLPAVLRGMHGEDYALMVMAQPVAEADLGSQLRAVWAARDECHLFGRRTRHSEHGQTSSWHEDMTEGSSRSKSKAGNIVLFSLSNQETVSEGRTTGTGGGRNWSDGLTLEQQDSLALELERLAERHSDRLLRAANVGAWETAITFATATTQGRDVLAGLLIGELAKPSADVFPLRAYYADLGPDRPLLLPAADGRSRVFPRSFACYLTSEELSAIASPPSEDLPGYEVRRIPTLSLTDASAPTSGWNLGQVCDHGRPLEGADVRLGRSDLAKHLFVCGLTGSGKTTTVREILAAADVPFLVLESAKRDYRQLIAVRALRDELRVFTPGDPTVAPLQMNPFYVLPGVAAGVHIDYLKAIFNASFSLYGPMPYIVEKCLHNIYTKRGWDLGHGTHPQLYHPDSQADDQRYNEPESLAYFPTLLDLRDEVHDYVRSHLDYRGELSDNIRTAIITRLESLAVGAKGLLFNSAARLDIRQFLAHPTVIELEALSDDDDKAFVVGLLLTFISEFRQTTNPALDPYAESGDELQHILVIEEAHRLLKNVVQERQSEHLGNPRGKAVEFFANVISEMRSMGQGVAVVEQIPSKLLPDVIKNTNTKIVHRLVSRDDQALLASTLGIDEDEAIYLTALRTGHALYAREGMQRPLELNVASTVRPMRISHERVRRMMLPRMPADAKDRTDAVAVHSALGGEGHTTVVRFLCTVACGEASVARTYATTAASRVSSQLRERGTNTSDVAVKRFLVSGVTDLLANGVFRLANGAPAGTSAVVMDLIDGAEHAGREIQRRLAEGWSVPDAREGATRRLCELVLDRARQAKVATGDRDAVDRIVATYFIADLPDVRDCIAEHVLDRLGEASWNL